MDEKVKIARTEAVFREVNEVIAKTAESFEADEADFVCECADPTCVHRISADLEKYEKVRRHPTRFLLAPGHEYDAVEEVVERRPGYTVVEKVERTVAEIVRHLNPRANPV